MICYVCTANLNLPSDTIAIVTCPNCKRNIITSECNDSDEITQLKDDIKLLKRKLENESQAALQREIIKNGETHKLNLTIAAQNNTILEHMNRTKTDNLALSNLRDTINAILKNPFSKIVPISDEDREKLHEKFKGIAKDYIDNQFKEIEKSYFSVIKTDTFNIDWGKLHDVICEIRSYKGQLF